MSETQKLWLASLVAMAVIGLLIIGAFRISPAASCGQGRDPRQIRLSGQLLAGCP